MCKFWRVSYSALILCSLLTGVVDAKSHRLSTGEELIDPTMPYGWQSQIQTKAAVKAPARQFKLSYILNADQRKQAIVNGQKVTEGDMVSGAKVLRIQEGAVTLLVDGQREILHLNKALGIKKIK